MPKHTSHYHHPLAKQKRPRDARALIRPLCGYNVPAWRVVMDTPEGRATVNCPSCVRVLKIVKTWPAEWFPEDKVIGVAASGEPVTISQAIARALGKE